ncbi:unnamed protein product [Amoebophrya sp. A25]|nr:unnamed protein product [Amoebophrya sp. A25]|eukprot:GSA25T00008163001.1
MEQEKRPHQVHLEQPQTQAIKMEDFNSFLVEVSAEEAKAHDQQQLPLFPAINQDGDDYEDQDTDTLAGLSRPSSRRSSCGYIKEEDHSSKNNIRSGDRDLQNIKSFAARPRASTTSTVSTSCGTTTTAASSQHNRDFRQVVPDLDQEQEKKPTVGQRRRLGICSRDRKVFGASMQAILKELENCAGDNLEAIVFGDDCILNKPVTEWPKVDFLICFHTHGFPLDKALEYIALHKEHMVCLNDVALQKDLLSRVFVYETLRKNGIPCPDFTVVTHDKERAHTGDADLFNTAFVDNDHADDDTRSVSSADSINSNSNEAGGTSSRLQHGVTRHAHQPQNSAATSSEDQLQMHQICTTSPTWPVEDEDWLEFADGRRLRKPFVEKPASAENHDIHVYYPTTSYGGGLTKIFRKQKLNGVVRSSTHHEESAPIRRDGTYIYEPFYHTAGVDLKVYAVGLDYAYAEARKAPVVDGYVEFDDRGEERRYPIVLTPQEKRIVAETAKAFKQCICGIDLLRHPTGTVVVDVNGLSFVKKRPVYFKACAEVLGRLFREYPRGSWWEEVVNARASSATGGDFFALQQQAMRDHLDLSSIPHLQSTKETLYRNPDLLLGGPASRLEENVQVDANTTSSPPEQVVAVLGCLRAAESTPREKTKALAFRVPGLLELLGHETEVTLQNRAELDKVRQILANPSNSASVEPRESLSKIVELLSAHFLLDQGIKGRLLKLKLKRHVVDTEKVWLVLKTGGDLTTEGMLQAERLGSFFRNQAYEGEDIAKLHQAYRHRLELKVTDDGCQLGTAAVFAKTLLQTSGSLPQSAVAYVKGIGIPGTAAQKRALAEARPRLYQILNSSENDPEEVASFFDEPAVSQVVRDVVHDYSSLRGALLHVASLVAYSRISETMSSLGTVSTASESGDAEARKMLERWTSVSQKLAGRDQVKAPASPAVASVEEQSNAPTSDTSSSLFDISVFPTLHWMLAYDFGKNRDLLERILPAAQELRQLVRRLAMIIIPQEFGLLREDKVRIAKQVLSPYLRAFRNELRSILDPHAHAAEQLKTLKSSGSLRQGVGNSTVLSQADEADEDFPARGDFLGVPVVVDEEHSPEPDDHLFLVNNNNNNNNDDERSGQQGRTSRGEDQKVETNNNNNIKDSSNRNDDADHKKLGAGALEASKDYKTSRSSASTMDIAKSSKLGPRRKSILFFTRKSILLSWLHLLLYHDVALITEVETREFLLGQLHSLNALAHLLLKVTTSGKVIVEFSTGIKDQEGSSKYSNKCCKQIDSGRGSRQRDVGQQQILPADEDLGHQVNRGQHQHHVYLQSRVLCRHSQEYFLSWLQAACQTT